MKGREEVENGNKIIWRAGKAVDFKIKLEKYNNRPEGETLQWENVKKRIWKAANSVGIVKTAGEGGSLEGKRKLSKECYELKKKVWKKLK